GINRVAYQWIPGAFSHLALCRLFPHATAQGLPTFADVFRAVENDEAVYGVLPFENSQAGDVSEVLDLCLQHPACSIHRMYDLPVSQNLLALPGATLAQIKRVVSHPQALRQCAAFVRQLHLSAEPKPNTAVAAQCVAEAGDPSLGAIASRETAALYGLTILCPDISEAADNATRFIVIGKELPTGGNRFSLLFTLRHEAGRLARAMEAIARLGYNMECIKSRPLPHMAWEYYFYTELVGEPTPALLDSLKVDCHTVRLLGRYERS
ncbi:MAG: bifunctional chorismate mutase/prephenate dehydratase, partial [Clostridia bacterium]|nr:bifunctional chorismate mutase/prephenate dehydratase [Clostridia bacterium]